MQTRECVTFILKRGLCSQTDIPLGFLSVLRVFVASATLGQRFELRSSHRHHLVSVHKLRSNTEYVIVTFIVQRGLCSHTDIPLVLSLPRVLIVAVRNFRPVILTSFSINLLRLKATTKHRVECSHRQPRSDSFLRL